MSTNRPVSKNFPATVSAVSDPSPGDQIIKCADFGKRPQCQETFVFTLGEQQFYADPSRNYPAPRRCKPCRDAKKTERGEPPRQQEAPRTDSGDYRKVWDDNRSEAPRGNRRRNRDDDF